MDARRDPWGYPLPDNTHKNVTSGWSVREHRRSVEVVRSGCRASGRAVRRARRTREGGRAVLRERRRRAGGRSGDMTGKCLLCGFDLGPDDNGNKRTGSHSQRTCVFRSWPCLHSLAADHPYHKEGRCFTADCAHLEKNCPKCSKDGHRVNTLRLDPSRFNIDNKGNITRRRGAPALTKSDFECSYLSEKDVAEWVRVQHDACWKEWREGQELAATGEKLAANVHDVGWDVVAAADVMEANGIAAATNGAENRSHFDAIVSAMDNPDETAVGAAVAAATGGAAAMSRARGRNRRIGRGRGGSAADSGAVRGGAGGVAAAAGAGRRPIDVDEIQPQSASPSPAGRRVRGRVDARGGSAGRGSRGASSSTSMQSGHGVGASGDAAGSNLATRSAVQMQQQHTSLMRAHAMRAADSVQRLLATGAGSTDGLGVGPRATAPLAGLRGRVGDGAPTAPVATSVAAAAAPLHLSWKVGERAKYDKAVVFECPAISGLTAEQLARKVFRGALREQAAAFPHIEQQFVDAANDNFLIGMNITCGVVSPADVAEQLMSRRVNVSNSNLLSLVSVWVKKYVDENVAASQVLGVSLGGESTWDAELAGSLSRRRAQPAGGTGRPPVGGRGGTRSGSVNDVDDEEDGEDEESGKDDDGDSGDEEEAPGKA